MKEYICKEVPTDNGGYLESVSELIRCKECRWFGRGYCNKYDLPCRAKDDYCSRAERKEDNG